MPSDRLPVKFPKFDNNEDERRHRKQRLAAAFRLFGHFGFDEGVAGHITARDPELLDHFWVNPLGMNFKQIRVKDLILVNDRGEVVDGNWPVNAAAFAIHSQIHAARPDVVAAAHAHSVYGKAWSSLRRPLDPLTQDCLRVLRRSRGVRRLHGSRARPRGRQAPGARPRREQGPHPVEPRVADRRADVGRRSGLVVHHDGAHVPGAVAGGGGGHARAHRSRPGREDRATGGSARWQAGRRSSRCTSGSCRSSPTCSRSERRLQLDHSAKPGDDVRTSSAPGLMAPVCCDDAFRSRCRAATGPVG